MTTGPALLAERANDDDLTVIKRVMGGEVDAFERLLRKYSVRVMTAVGRKIPAEDIELVAQDVFLSAFRSLGTYEAVQPFEHWLARIVRRRCCDYWRERERRCRTETVSIDEPEHAGVDFAISGEARKRRLGDHAREDAAAAVHQALGKLNAEDRALMEAVYFEDVPLKEMAGTLGWSLVKTKVRAHRARHKLRVIMETMSGNEVKQ
jgi:RNA polymerase sigma-70 factor, ECF subfamily